MRQNHPEQKVSTVTTLILIGFVLITLKMGYLAIFDHERAYHSTRKPKEKVVIREGLRGTIRDRFNIPLATNRTNYQIECLFEPLLKMRRKDRLAYIPQLCAFLAETLHIDAALLEEKLYAFSAPCPQKPWTIASHISEKQFYFLKARESRWKGLIVRETPERFYPLGETGCHLLGFVGKLSQEEYKRQGQKITQLEQCIFSHNHGNPVPLVQGYHSIESIKEDFFTLSHKRYFRDSAVGKAGIERFYEEALRGWNGKELFEINHNGSVLCQLPTKEPQKPGGRLILSISAELQAFAEKLLADNERWRRESFRSRDTKQERLPPPDILGGCLIAMLPQTGEIVAMASYPTFDPNAFIKGSSEEISPYLENRDFILRLWHGLSTFQGKKICWSDLLHTALHPSSPILKAAPLFKVADLWRMIELEGKSAYFAKDPWIGGQLLEDAQWPILLDFARTICDWKMLSPPTDFIGDLSLDALHALIGQIHLQREKIGKEAFDHFRKEIFPQWQQLHFKDYLREKRLFEKMAKMPQKPAMQHLIELREYHFKAYLASEEERLLKESLLFLGIDEASLTQLIRAANRSSLELSPLWGNYHSYDRTLHNCQDLALCFYPKNGYGFLKSYAIEEPTVAGSIFKILTTLAAKDVESFHVTDLSPKEGGGPLAYLEDGTAVYRSYKGGRMPKSAKPIGKVDCISAFESSSNLFFSLLAANNIDHPKNLLYKAMDFGFGKKSQIDLPKEHSGYVPLRSVEERSELYALAMGQGQLTATPLQMALLFSTLANGGILHSPKLCQKKIDFCLPLKSSPFDRKQIPLHHFYQPLSLKAPIFTQTIEEEYVKSKTLLSPPKKHIPIEEGVRKRLLLGLYRSVNSEHGTARPQTIKALMRDPLLKRTYLSICPYMAGKTATSEFSYKPWLDPTPSCILNHILFGAISFNSPIAADQQSLPPSDLVVLVLLRYGYFGKDAAPLAAQVIQKWNEIKGRLP